MDNSINLSIIVPAYNEEDSISSVIESIEKAVIQNIAKFELIVVDDGSTDRTVDIAQRFADKNKIRLFRHTANLGMGRAITTGVMHASFPFIIDIPCDNQFNSNDIPRFIEKINSADIVVGYRENKATTPKRKFYSWFNLMLLNILFGLDLNDPTWVKMFRRDVFDKIKLESDGFFWETEILVKAKELGFRIKEVKSNMLPRSRGISKGDSIFRAMDVFLAMMRLWLGKKIHK